MTDHAKELESIANKTYELVSLPYAPRYHIYNAETRTIIENAAAKLRRLQSEKTRLITELIEARNDIESWAAYATEYFQEKHDLSGNLKRIDDFLKGIEDGL